MKAKKPDNRVAGMAVLKDIKGLLSTTRDPAVAVEVDSKTKTDARAGNDRLAEQLKEYEQLVLKQQAALDRLEAEKKELEAKLSGLQSAQGRPETQKTDNDRLTRDISDLEARRDELSAALTQIEGMLQIKIKELARRIAQIFQEAGDMYAVRDFRRVTDQLEAAGNFGEFLRTLLRE
jgi:chromosome segregation ATPase